LEFGEAGYYFISSSRSFTHWSNVVSFGAIQLHNSFFGHSCYLLVQCGILIFGIIDELDFDLTKSALQRPE